MTLATMTVTLLPAEMDTLIILSSQNIKPIIITQDYSITKPTTKPGLNELNPGLNKKYHGIKPRTA